ncbi:MAG: hypothetical protein FWC50_01480 [Planctomycetaceae bacterium]|nr:hypothetical protein [Planctomycetaceae bacterium]
MSNKKGLSFEARLWLFIFVLIVFLCVISTVGVLGNVVGFIVYSPNSTGIAVVVAACIIASAIIIAAGILAYTIHKIFGKNKDNEKK